MLFSRKLTHVVVALVCIGMVAPQTVFAAPKAATVTVKARDVALSKTGELSGAVLNAQARPVDGAKVVLTQDGKVVATSVTVKNGTFTLPQVKSGSYIIAVGEAKAPIRVWSSEAAPANAARNMALASEGVIRGQGQGQYCPPEGEYCPPGGVLGGLDIITLATVTAAVGALVIGAVNNAKINDINDKLDKLASP